MKLTVGKGAKESGFALPTILLVSTVMLTILTASIAAAAASRVSLDSQYYNQLAKQAAQSGIARAKECLVGSGYTPQWSTIAASRDLRPNTDCTGVAMSGPNVSAYVVGNADIPPSKVRTRYSIEAPNGTGIGSILQVVGTTELVRTSSPHNVWRSYQQSVYHRIEAPPAVACPQGFVSVPGDSRFNTNDFCIGKYEAKNVGGTVVSQAGGVPYTTVSQTAALNLATLSCSGCKLVTEGQWLTVMHNAFGVSSNWSGGAPGSGHIYSGHNDNSPSNALAASTDDSDGYFGTSNTSGNQRRTLSLSNGEVVWDMAGNVWEWTAGTATGGQPGLATYAWREWNAGGLSAGTISPPARPNPLPSFGTPAASGWTSTNGIGRLYSSTSEAGLRGIGRGGFWNSTASAGIAAASYNEPPATASSSIGFRIAFEPLSEITCATGFIPVPGNNVFGTNNFCVAKYETKNASGARSQAAGQPWVSITQAAAVTASNNAGYRLISEAEWLTIAHNVVNVQSNWMTGVVGSGSLFRGHSDSTPAARLAASTDNDPYSGTGNSGNNQLRTLTLSNGEIIWDFSGNVAEWTTATISGGQPGSAASYGWRDWNTVTGGGLNPSPFPAFATPAASAWTYNEGIGRIRSHTTDVTTRGFVRGGSYSTGVDTGVFSLNLEIGSSSAEVGFRMVQVSQ